MVMGETFEAGSWNVDMEVDLFHAMRGHKPVGKCLYILYTKYVYVCVCIHVCLHVCMLVCVEGGGEGVA